MAGMSTTCAKGVKHCKQCDAVLLAGPSGWVCPACPAKIELYGGYVPDELDIVPSDAPPARNLCEECNGTGNVECEECDGDGYEVCEHCSSEVHCPHCDGEGNVECPECGGTGFEEDEQ